MSSDQWLLFNDLSFKFNMLIQQLYNSKCKRYIGTFMYFYYLLTDFILITYKWTDGLLNNTYIKSSELVCK